MRIKRLLFITVLFVVLSLVVISCGKEKIRNYSEETPQKEQVSQENFHDRSGQDLEVRQNIMWDTPSGWTPVDTKSRLRIATFSVKLDDKKAECTIIPLHGNGGGLIPNTRMWYGTVTGKDISDNELNEFLKAKKEFKTLSGLDGIFIDFTGTISKNGDFSMMISVITLPEKTLFIKLSGDKSVIINNRDKFMKLSESVRIVK